MRLLLLSSAAAARGNVTASASIAIIANPILARCSGICALSIFSAPRDPLFPILGRGQGEGARGRQSPSHPSVGPLTPFYKRGRVPARARGNLHL